MAVRPPVRPPGFKQANPTGQVAQALLGHPPAQAPSAAALGAVPSIRSLVSGLGANPQQRQPGSVGAGPQGPQPPKVVTTQEGFNPYTGQRLGANEYVGVAGTEAQNEGKSRIPPPGWWDPANPNYERRNYYIAPDGKMVAREAGFRASEDDPYDTGREQEINAEYEGRPGGQMINLGEPGITPWGRGQERPKAPEYARGGSGAPGTAAPRAPGQLLAGLAGSGPRANVPGSMSDPNSQLMELIRALIGRTPGGGSRTPA